MDQSLESVLLPENSVLTGVERLVFIDHGTHFADPKITAFFIGQQPVQTLDKHRPVLQSS
jgi:hypothetical protein